MLKIFLKKKSKDLLPVVICSIIVLVIVSVVYILYLRNEINKTTMETMQELSYHDISIINGRVESDFERLHNIAAGLEVMNGDIESVQKQMLGIKLMSGFDRMLLVDESGMLYAATMQILDGSSLTPVEKLMTGEERVIERFSGAGALAEIFSGKVIYGIRINDLVIGDTRIIGILGAVPIEDIGDKLKVTSFNDRGITTVVGHKGYYIVNQIPGVTLGGDNAFNNLQHYDIKGGYSVEKIINELNEGKTVTFSASKDGKWVFLITPIDFLDWYVIMRVSGDVFVEQSMSIILSTMIILIIFLIALGAICIIFVQSLGETVAAEATADVRTKFLNSMSHEIRTPLNGIIGLGYLLRQNLDDREKVENYLVKLENTSKYLLSLINNVLDMSKLSENRFEYSISPYSITEAISLVESVVQEMMNTNGINFTVEYNIKYPIIMGDEMRFKQVILNILGNAAKFTPRDGCVTAKAWQDEPSDGKITTYFEVRDTGIGMSDKFQKQIFEAFSQEVSVDNHGRSINGTGLGMAISYSIMKNLGGSLEVESELGKGSTFTVTLPAEYLEEIPVMPNVPPVYDNTELTTAKNILVAEDNEINAEILTEILEEAGHSTVLAHNGQEAVDAFKNSPIGYFHIILMDVQMPLMDGYAASNAIRHLERKDAKSVKIYACTANTASDVDDNTRASGMNGVISKPIDFEKLNKLLNN